jgi:hypothetical protein
MKVAVVSSRDFILILHFNMLANGTIKVIVFSTDKDEL